MIEWFNSLRIESLQAHTTNSKVKTNLNETHLRVVEDKLDSLYILTMASLELLNESGISKQQIMDKIEEIDLRDGVKDGKIARQTKCGDCGHRVSKRKPNCFYCGAKINEFGYS